MTPRGEAGTAWRVIIGPPGTGKTTRLLQFLQQEIDSGLTTTSIAFLTFTRAARDEARGRVGDLFGLVPEDLPWFRTIHSAAYALLGLKRGTVLSRSDWHAFGCRFGYRLSDLEQHGDDYASELPSRTRDDLLRFAHDWGANRRLGIAGTLRHCPVDVSPVHYPLFVERLRTFKGEHGLLDFPDMLVRVIEKGLCPDVAVVFLDEAQDLSPLQIAVFEQWADPCRRVYVAGDDDQAIYSFQGADPSWLCGLAKRYPVEILQQSHRVPRTVFEIAQTVIGGNRARIVKVYRPTASDGLVERIETNKLVGILDPRTDTLVIARNREFLRSVARALYEARVPYVVEGPGGINPLGNVDVVRAVRTSIAIFTGRPVDASDLETLLTFIPSRGHDLLPHGVKQRVKERRGAISIEAMRDDLGLGGLLDRIHLKGPCEVLLKLSASERGFLQDVVARHGEVPEPAIHLTTIHGAKGREAETVVVIPDMSRATYREYTDHSRGGFEAENRVAYVAVTRAKRRLILVEPRTRRFFDYPTPQLLSMIGSRPAAGSIPSDRADVRERHA